VPILPFPRTTRSGACATCGAYGGTPHRPNCQPRTGPRPRLGRMLAARGDARKSAAARAKDRVELALIRGL
jgi:hypothetical protein